MSTVEDYLGRAGVAGLLDEVRGHPYVADRYDDPISGARQVLVEYCDPRLTGDPRALNALRERLRERHPAAESVLLRLAGQASLPAPWSPRLTYLRYERSEGAERPEGSAGVVPEVPEVPEVTVRPATADDDERVHGWLVQAFRNAYPEQEVDPAHPAIEAIMKTLGRLSFIACAGGTPLGHGTVLTQERDEVSGEPFAELVDILVDDAAHRRAATQALVAAVARATPGLRLCGNVVHPREPGAARRSEEVLSMLLRTHWSTDHRFWESTW
ncbi:hypothetical protein [Streptomyces sp. NPDC054863]